MMTRPRLSLLNVNAIALKLRDRLAKPAVGLPQARFELGRVSPAELVDPAAVHYLLGHTVRFGCVPLDAAGKAGYGLYQRCQLRDGGALAGTDV